MYCFNCRLVGPLFQSDELPLETLPTHLQLSKERESEGLSATPALRSKELYSTAVHIRVETDVEPFKRSVWMENSTIE